MPRFVILTHDHPFPHWDLMLECGGALHTWRLRREPVPDAGIPAEPLPDHRLAYLDYEGPVSGGRGTVARWDFGTYEPLTSEVESWAARLSGARGAYRIALSTDGDGKIWTFESISATSGDALSS